MSKYQLTSEEVRRIRRSLGETQAQFAKRLQVDAVTVARWETGQRNCTGLYAKTIMELGAMSTGREFQFEDDEQENVIKTVELHEVYSFRDNTAPLLQFLYKVLYKEVSLDYRNGILSKYQQWFEVWAYNSSFFDGVFNRRLIHEVGHFLRPVCSGPINSEEPGQYAGQKLAKSHRAIYEIAKNLAPNCEALQTKHSMDERLSGRQRLTFIKLAVDDLLEEPTLSIRNKGDIVLLKFYRCLIQFAWDEMDQGKFLTIPASVSSSFADVLSVGLRGPFTISVPGIYDHNELEDIDKATKDSLKGLEKSTSPKFLGISFLVIVIAVAIVGIPATFSI